MNRDEAKDILRRRLDLTGDTFNQSMLDTWAEQLAHIDYGEAVVALTRTATNHGHVRWHDFHAELKAHQAGKTNRSDETFDCQLCQGTGWKDAGAARRGNSSVEPCTNHIRPGRPIPPAEGIAHAAVACEEEMRRMGKTSADIDRVLGRWFGTRHEDAA